MNEPETTSGEWAAPAAPANCEHHYASLHEPGHTLYWVCICQLCHAPDWGRLDKDIDERVAAPLRARIAELEDERDHAASAAAGSHEGIRLWMLDCGQLVEKHRARIAELEQRVSELRTIITEMHRHVPPHAARAGKWRKRAGLETS